MKIVRSILLWILAVLIAVVFMVYQRKTGPTYPIKGSFEIGEMSYDYKLLRSHELAPDESGSLDHTVSLAIPDTSVAATLLWKRLGVDEPFTPVEMARIGDNLEAQLPHQPAAGKLIYHIRVTRGEEVVDLPSSSETVTLRYKGAVPTGVLLPHILAMIIVMILSVRTAIAAIARERIKTLSWITFFVVLVGGMILGPIVQKYAFDAYWTGWPFGGDLTDNKTLVAVIAWFVAVMMMRGPEGEKKGRWWAVGATVVVLAVYTIPHSMGGSTFDYEAGTINTGLSTEVKEVQTFDSTGVESAEEAP